MTTQSKKYSIRIEIKHDNKKGWIVHDQILTIKQRIYKTLDSLSVKEIEKVKMTIKELLVDLKQKL